MTKDSTILSLLTDTDRHSVAAAFNLLYQQYPNPDTFIAAHLDDSNPMLHRRLHQLTCFVRRREVHRDFVERIRHKSLLFWDCMLLFNQLVDIRVNAEVIREAVDTYEFLHFPKCNGRQQFGTQDIVQMFREAPMLPCHGMDYFHLDNLLLLECMHSGYAHPLILCECAKHVGAKANWHPSIVMTGGQYMLLCGQDLIIPENNWEIKKQDPQSVHVCSNEELARALLGFGLAMSIIESFPLEMNYLGSLVTELEHSTLDTLPFPLGAKQIDTSKIKINTKETNHA